MFAELKSVVDLIRTGIADYRGFSSKKAREKAVLDVLKTYFLMLDCVEEGEKLIAEAGPDPVGKVRAMETSEACATLNGWDFALRKQAIRLRNLQEFIFGQDHLTVINPALQNQIEVIVGSKFDSGLTLFKIGAHLFFSSIFPVETNEERAETVLIMAGSENDTLDMNKINSDIIALRESLDQYRGVLSRLVSDEELLALSRQAREETYLNGT